MSRAEKFIEDCTRNCSNELIAVESRAGKEVVSYYEWLTPDQARRAVEIAREEVIERAIKWVEYNNKNGGCKFDGWVKNIKQAMKDETQNL